VISDNHNIITGSHQLACFISFQVRSISFFTFQYPVFVTRISHIFNVPVITIIVVVTHCFASLFDSKITQTDFLLGLYFRLRSLAFIEIVSNKSSIHSQVCDETNTIGTSPPRSSGTNHCSLIWDFIISKFNPALSIFVIATIILTQDCFAWLIASMVCGLIQSSAAITMIAILVNLAHLALIALNNSCHGVSTNVIFSQLCKILLAHID
jgi:hypothetical protein